MIYMYYFIVFKKCINAITRTEAGASEQYGVGRLIIFFFFFFGGRMYDCAL